jgi:hypothetical protein
MLRNIGSMYYLRVQVLVATMFIVVVFCTGINLIFIWSHAPVDASNTTQYEVTHQASTSAEFPSEFLEHTFGKLFGPFTFMFVAVLVLMYFIISMVDAGGETNGQITCSNRMLLEHQLKMFSLAEKIPRAQPVNGASRAAKSGRLSQVRERTRRYLLSAARGMEDTRMFMLETFRVRPITFLFLKASPGLYRIVLLNVSVTVVVFLQSLLEQGS